MQHQEPQGLNDSSNVWIDNKAPYGSKYGTQTVVITSPVVYDVEVYGTELTPPVVFEYLDYYGNKISGNTNAPTKAIMTQYQCFGWPGSIYGALVEPAVLGTISYDSMGASCYPGGNLTVEFQVSTIEFAFFGLQYPWRYYVENSSIFNFRSCIPGERLIQGACITCAYGSYLLSFDPGRLKMIRGKLS